MKIAYIAPSFPPELGGMGSACYYTANEVGKSHDVTVFVIDREENYKKGNYEIKKLDPLFSFGYADFTPSILKEIEDFDIIHVYYPYFGIAELLIWNKIFKKVKNPKIILHQEMDMVGEGVSKFVNNIHKKTILNCLFKNSDLNFVLSEDYVKHSDIKKTFKKYSEKFKVVPNGVNTEKFKPIGEKNKTFTIFTAQGLDKQHFFKGIEVLIKAFNILITENKLDVKLVIAGGGDLKEHYEKLVEKLGIEKSVKFLGRLNHDQLPEQYSKAHVTAVPSTRRTESFSITAAESMACETPVIVSNWPGLRVTIKDKITGLICEPKDEKDLAKQIKYLYDDPEELEKMSKASRKRAVENFDWKNIAEKCVANYKELLKK